MTNTIIISPTKTSIWTRSPIIQPELISSECAYRLAVEYPLANDDLIEELKYQIFSHLHFRSLALSEENFQLCLNCVLSHYKETDALSHKIAEVRSELTNVLTEYDGFCFPGTAKEYFLDTIPQIAYDDRAFTNLAKSCAFSIQVRSQKQVYTFHNEGAEYTLVVFVDETAAHAHVTCIANHETLHFLRNPLVRMKPAKILVAVKKDLILLNNVVQVIDSKNLGGVFQEAFPQLERKITEDLFKKKKEASVKRNAPIAKPRKNRAVPKLEPVPDTPLSDEYKSAGFGQRFSKPLNAKPFMGKKGNTLITDTNPRRKMNNGHGPGRSFALAAGSPSHDFPDLENLIQGDGKAQLLNEQHQLLEDHFHFLDTNGGMASASSFEVAVGQQGALIPCSTFDGTLVTLSNVIGGLQDHPKRFGNETLVLPTVASAIVPLVNYVPGNTVIVCVANSSAYKGAIVLQMPPVATTEFVFDTSATTSRTVIAVVPPDRDPEALGESLNVLFSKLSISAPTIVGGTTISTAQISQESAITNAGPMQVIPGKLASLAQNRSAPIMVIGTETHSIINFTADAPTAVVQRFTGYGLPNRDLVRVPGGALPAAVTATIENSEAFVIETGQVSTSTMGFILPILGIGPATKTIFYNLNESPDFNRHLLFGDFEMKGFVRLQTQTTGIQDASASYVGATVTYHDGTLRDFRRYNNNAYLSTVAPWIDQEFSFDFTEYQEVGDHDFGGLLIANVALYFYTPNYTNLDVDIMRGGVSLHFDAVPAQGTYTVMQLTGAQLGAQINIDLAVHTEVRVNPTSIKANFISPSPSFAYSKSFLPSTVEYMRRNGFDFTVTTPKGASQLFIAGAFGRKLKDFFGKVFKVIRGPATAALSAVANTFAPGSGKMVGSVLNSVGDSIDQTIDKNVAQRRLDYPKEYKSRNFRSRQAHAHDFRSTDTSPFPELDQLALPQYGYPTATTFSSGTSVKLTGFGFPGVYSAQPPVTLLGEPPLAPLAALVKFFAICQGGGFNQPPFVSQLTSTRYNAVPRDFKGRSADLAFCLAALSGLGFPTKQGIYSGQISNAAFINDTCSFTIDPIDCSKEKIADFAARGIQITLLAPDGLYVDGQLVANANASAFFNFPRRSDVEWVDPPFNTPGRSLYVTYTKP